MSRRKVTINEEERSHNPRNLDYYMEAVQDGYAGMHKMGQLEGDAVEEESGHSQSLTSHPGPVDREETSRGDATHGWLHRGAFR